VIVDRGPAGEDPARLIGYKRGAKGWVPLPPDEQGRLNLTPVGLLLGVVDDHPWFYDVTTGQRLPDRTELTAALAEAEARAQREEARARAEAQARESLEQRLRELEAQLHRQDDQPKS
jgi:hypothetical protein